MSRAPQYGSGDAWIFGFLAVAAVTALILGLILG